MLKDQVNNRLAVISMNSQLSRTLEPEKRKKMLRAIHEIDRMLDELSEDSFLNWKAHYRGDE
jgi:signal transduction histidine kinase